LIKPAMERVFPEGAIAAPAERVRRPSLRMRLMLLVVASVRTRDAAAIAPLSDRR